MIVDRSGSIGTNTKIAKLLPALRRGDREAIDEVIEIAYNRLEQLIRDKKIIFAGGMARRNYRGDEQTGHIMSELYLRLRKAVEGHKLGQLRHPAGFWKIAADHVMFILLDLARTRKRERERGRPAHSQSDDSQPDDSQPDDSQRDDSRQSGANGPAPSPIELVVDPRPDDVEHYILRQEILEAIDRLPEPHRTVLSMYYYLGASQREISEVMLADEPNMYERKVGRIIEQAEEMLRPLLDDTSR